MMRSGYGPGRRDYEADVREDAARAKRQPIGRLLVETIDAAAEQEEDPKRREVLLRNVIMISGTLNQANIDVTTDEAERILRDLGVLPSLRPITEAEREQWMEDYRAVPEPVPADAGAAEAEPLGWRVHQLNPDEWLAPEDAAILKRDAGADAIAAIVRQDELGAPTPEPKKAHRLSVTKYDGKADYPYRAECICGWKGISHKTAAATLNSQKTHADAYGFALEGK